MVWLDIRFNSSVFLLNGLFFRCLNASLELFLDEERDPEQYLTTFNRMFGDDIVRQGHGRIFKAMNASLDCKLLILRCKLSKAIKKLLQAYAKLQKAKQAFHEQR